MIDSLLGAPDQTKANPRSRRAAPLRLYAIDRVVAAEAAPFFRDRQRAAARRRETAIVSAATRIAVILELVEAMPIRIADTPFSLLSQLASENREKWAKQGRAERQSFGESAAAFERRVVVNYVRHRLTSYDRALEQTARRVGATAARERIRQRVYEAIATAYPPLAGECRRQMRHRHVPDTVRQMDQTSAR
jgi:hypothetical protein